MKLWNHIKSLPIHELLLYIFLIVLPFQTRIIYNPNAAYINSYFSYPLAYFVYASDMAFILLTITWLIFVKKNVSPIYKSEILLILWVFLTLFGVKHFSIGFYQAFKWLEFILLAYIVATSVTHETQKLKAAWILYLSGVLQAILAIWQFHVQHGFGLKLLGEYVPTVTTAGAATLDFDGTRIIRAYGTFPHPNVLAAFILITLILGFYIVSRETNIKKLVLLGFFNILLILGLFLTFSRVAWFTAAIAGVSFFIYYLVTKSGKYAINIGLSGVVSCATILIGWNKLLFSRATDVVNSRSFTDRGTFNHFGLEIFKQNWLTGVGVGNYIPQLQQMFHLEDWQYQPSHNIFIYVAASLGIVGLILFLYLLFKVFQILFRSKPSVWRFTMMVLGFSLLFISNFDHFLVTIQQGQLLFFTSLGLMAASGGHPERSEGSND